MCSAHFVASDWLHLADPESSCVFNYCASPPSSSLSALAVSEILASFASTTADLLLPHVKGLHKITRGVYVRAYWVGTASQERLHPLCSALLLCLSPAFVSAPSLGAAGREGWRDGGADYLVGGAKERHRNKNSCLWWSGRNWDC